MSVSLLFHSLAIVMHLEVTPLIMESNKQSTLVVVFRCFVPDPFSYV